MLLLIVSWLIILLAALKASRWIGLFNRVSYFLSFISGLGLILLIAQIWTLFFPSHHLFFPILGLALAELIKDRGEEFRIILKNRFLSSGVLLIACLIPSVLQVWINDDSAYYMPSIKWYAEEGFVRGLSQWNIRYGLASSWHLLSSIFYFDGISPDRVWNFNGLLLFLFSYDLYKRYENILLLIPLLILCAPFLNAPSPDLPIILLTIHVILFNKQLSAREWTFFLLFAFGIKATGLSLILIGFYPLIKYRLQFLRYAWILIPLGLAWIMKNTLLTGHVLFPLNSPWTDEVHALPISVLNEFKNGVLAEIYGLGFSAEAWQEAGLNFAQRFLHLFMLKPYKVLMNLMIVGGGIMLIGYYREDKIRKLPIMSLWTASSLALWFIMAPNYRFALGIGIGSCIVLLRGQSLFQLNPIFSKLGLGILAAGMIWMNTQGTNYVRVVSCGQPEELSFKQLLVPVSYPEVPYQKLESNGLEYYRPGDCLYCGDTPRPCLPDTVKRTHKKYGIYPLK